MSLILEALRKSEAERQRGRAPGLFVAQATRPAPARRAPGWAWALAALLLAVLVAWGVREWQRGAEVIPASAPATAGADATADAAPATAMGAAPTATAAPVPVSASASAAPASAPAPATAPPPSTAAVAPSPGTPQSPALAPPAEAPIASAALPSAEPPAAPPPLSQSEPPLPTLAQLSADERARLPPLKLSMHVYGDDPAQRFVILDGQRLGEGASPAAGVVLEQIRRDGLVLSVNGQRLLLARP